MVGQQSGASSRSGTASPWRRWLAASSLLFVASCLLPSYGLDDPAAAGGSGGATGAQAGNGAQSPGGSSTGATAGTDVGSAGSAGTSGAAGNGPLVCPSDQKPCGGECVKVDDPAYGCGKTSCNQSSCPAGGASFACEGEECVIASCGAGMKACAGRCVAVSDPTYGCSPAGCDASSCPDPGVGTLRCSGPNCIVGDCTADTKKCGPNCVPRDANYGCDEAGRCTPCSANQVCSGEPGSTACACIPDDVEACEGLACGDSVNNCGDAIECPDTCVAPLECDPVGLTPNNCDCIGDNPCQVDCGTKLDNCGEEWQCENYCEGTNKPNCANNTCVECNVAADCPAPPPCTKNSCTNNKCVLSAVAQNTACPGGTCGAGGVCNRTAITVSTFNIDATEVTRGQYRAFLTAKNGNTSGQPSVCSWNTSYVPTYEPASKWPPTLADYDAPVVGVDWCDAVAYCTHVGRRLCGNIGGASGVDGSTGSHTTGQWMRACAGPGGTAYSYGNAYVAGRCADASQNPVATFPQCVGSAAGLYDMSGNVAEWVDDCYTFDGNCIVRGARYFAGSNGDNPDDTMCASAIQTAKTSARDNVGFRCCSNP